MFQFQSISGSSLTLSPFLSAYTKVLSSSNRRLRIEDEARKRQLNVHVNGPHQPNRLCHSFEQHLLARLCEMDCRKTKSNCKLLLYSRSTSCGRISYKFRSFCCCFRFFRSHFFLRLANQKTSIVCHSLGQNPYHRENGSRLFPFQKYLSCHFVVAIICLYLFKLKPLYFVEFHAI